MSASIGTDFTRNNALIEEEVSMERENIRRIMDFLDSISEGTRLNDLMNKLPPEYRKKLGNVISNLMQNVELDKDFLNRRDVYNNIAKFLNKRFTKPYAICLRVVHELCGESDPRLTQEGISGSNDRELDFKDLLQASKEMILAIKVNYLPLDNRNYKRRTEIWYLKDKSPASTTFEETIMWDELPPDVRESRLRQNLEMVGFTLYPKET